MNLPTKHIVYARRHTSQYRAFTERAYLAEPDMSTAAGMQAVYNRLLFALLSVNTDYEVTARAFQAMRGRLWLTYSETLAEYLKHGIHYAGARAGYLVEASAMFGGNPSQFLKSANETWNDYRTRLVASIPGLSWCKVSFFIGMIYRDADICCLDRHMLRALGVRNVEKLQGKLSYSGPAGGRRYQALEAIVRNRKPKALSLPAFQWAVWDSVQQSTNPMEELA